MYEVLSWSPDKLSLNLRSGLRAGTPSKAWSQVNSVCSTEQIELSLQKKIDILKLSMAMNEEWEVLPQLLREGTLTRQVKQLLLTVHLDSTRADELIRWQAIIDWLGLQGFRLFNRNKGRLCDNCYELSWINDYI